MSLNNDYFLLYHGLAYEGWRDTDFRSLDETILYETSALVLSTTRKNFYQFTTLASFQHIIKNLSYPECYSLDELYLLQSSLITYIQKHMSKQQIKILHKAFDYLKAESLLSIENHAKLLSLFDPKSFHIYEQAPIDIVDENEDFLEQKKSLKSFIQSLLETSKSEAFGNELQSLLSYLDRQKFSIGITGVMNAGKSTLLNALMGKEILGSSVVPETANLTLLKYSKSSYAKVFYWSYQEWEKIICSGKELEGIGAFVKQTQEAFDGDLSKYIQDDRRVDTIDVKDLSLYTSANKSKYRCNLIKQVELGVDLEFLSEGIEIVDTPGLDDVIIQREEITKEYLSHCDVMIHLMNVSQSATQKDIEFIIDTLRYQNISKLLIVLTRADTVKENELKEVIEYTKKSIESQLKNIKAEAQLDSMLASLEFIAVSSKMVLLHKTGQGEAALSQGYTLEKSGITRLEAYLFKTLYGDQSEKSDLILNSTRKRLYKIIEAELKILAFKLHLLSQSKAELEIKDQKVQERKVNDNALIVSLKEELSGYVDEIRSYGHSLNTFLDTQMLRVEQRLQSRLMDDLAYAFEKKEKKEFFLRIDAMVDGAIKDGLIDILRDYRYKYIQKSEEVGVKISRKYEEYTLETEGNNDTFSALHLINEHFKGNLLHSSSALLTSKVEQILKNSNADRLSLTEEKLSSTLDKAFESIQKSLQEKVQKISEDLVIEFSSIIHQPLLKLEKNMRDEEELLEVSLHAYEEDENKRAKASIELHDYLKSLQLALQRCKL